MSEIRTLPGNAAFARTPLADSDRFKYRKSFPVEFIFADMVKEMPDEETGLLFKEISKYAKDHSYTSSAISGHESLALRMAYQYFTQMDNENFERWKHGRRRQRWEKPSEE